MGLFKEIYCAKCGKKTNIFTRTKLADGNYLCAECMSVVPSFMRQSVSDRYSIDDYNDLLDYIAYSHKELRPQFRESHSYYSVRIDTESRIMYLGYGIDDKTVFFHMHNVEDFELVFRGEEFKEGIVGGKVKGKILMTLKMGTPYFYHEEILDHSAKAKARKRMLSSEIEYENPNGMDEFMLHFLNAWRKSIEEAENEYEDDSDGYSAPAVADELQQAMALFMLDGLEGVTLNEIKSQRNRLLKTFHPDKGSADDAKFAQKINNAYDVLKQYLA